MVDTLTFVIVALVYVALTIGLGYLGWKRTASSDDFMVAGRNVHPVIIALSYGATFLSTSAIVGFGGVSAQLGIGTLWLVMMNILVGILVAFILFGKRTRALGMKLKAVTFSDLMAKAYRSRFMQVATAVVILVGMPLYTAAILIGGARFIEGTLDINYDLALLSFAAIVALYVILGGLIAVMYTDALQGGIMFIGMFILLAFTMYLLGGVTPAFEKLTSMADMVPAGLSSAGMTGWTSFPILGSPLWFTFVTTFILSVGIGVLAQPQLVVRFMTAKDDRSLNRAVAVGGIFVLVITGAAYTVGGLTNVYFHEKYGMIATEYVGNIDKIIPTFVNESMPDLFVIVFLLALLAAAMSTLSSLLHTMGTAAGYDLWRAIKDRGKPYDPSDNKNIPKSFRASQIGTVLMIVVSVVVAYQLPGDIIARATAMFMGLCCAAFLPAFAHCLYSKRPNEMAAKASLVVGTVTWFLWTAFVHIKESSARGLCQWLFGRPSLLDSPWTVVDPVIIALPMSILTLVVVIFVWRSKVVIDTVPENNEMVSMGKG